MKIWTVISGVVSTLLVASILTFGLSTEIASAHGPVCEKHHKKDDGCSPPGGGGEDKTETVFLVKMRPTDDTDGKPGLVTTVPLCSGSTKDELRPGGVGAVFPDDCAFINVNFDPPDGAPLLLELWYVQVNLNKSKVDMGFRADNENNLFVINNLPVTIIPDPVELSSAFTVGVNKFGLTAERNHNPGKGDLVGPIAIGEIIYTPE